MAQFRGTLRGQRGEASRLGGKSSGLVARANGWHSGIEVVAEVDKEQRDRFRVWATGGSAGGAPDRLLGTLVGGVWYPSGHGEDNTNTAEAVRHAAYVRGLAEGAAAGAEDAAR